MEQLKKKIPMWEIPVLVYGGSHRVATDFKSMLVHGRDLPYLQPAP